MTANNVAPIQPEVLYPLGTFPMLCGTGVRQLHELHADGVLRLHRTGNRWWILGRTWIDYVTSKDAIPRRRGRSYSSPEDEGDNPKGGSHVQRTQRSDWESVSHSEGRGIVPDRA
jgi:hypothetical protein